MDTGSTFYKNAFDTYLRTGGPVELSLKQRQITTFPTITHYIWRTRKDSKVRSTHAANDGKVFAWNNPPATGHPGQAYGCRCRAEPFLPNVSETMLISLSNVNDTGPDWSSADFVNHYFYGNGGDVILRQVGHLEKIVSFYMKRAEQNLKGQIADAARKNVGQTFLYDFYSTYDTERTVFSLGRTEIGGVFNGSCVAKQGALEVIGSLHFYLDDKFTDPVDLGFDLPSSQLYDIFDYWSGSLRGLVLKDRAKSRFKYK